MDNQAFYKILEQGLRRPKYSRVFGLYCCNDRECRREQNRAFRMIQRAQKVKAKKGGLTSWEWFASEPAEGVKPSKKANRGGW